jgi:hypothetical protein
MLFFFYNYVCYRLHERDEANVKQWIYALQSAVFAGIFAILVISLLLMHFSKDAEIQVEYDSDEVCTRLHCDPFFFLNYDGGTLLKISSEEESEMEEGQPVLSKEVLTSAEQAVLAEVKQALLKVSRIYISTNVNYLFYF